MPDKVETILRMLTSAASGCSMGKSSCNPVPSDGKHQHIFSAELGQYMVRSGITWGPNLNLNSFIILSGPQAHLKIILSLKLDRLASGQVVLPGGVVVLVVICLCYVEVLVGWVPVPDFVERCREHKLDTTQHLHNCNLGMLPKLYLPWLNPSASRSIAKAGLQVFLCFTYVA